MNKFCQDLRYDLKIVVLQIKKDNRDNSRIIFLSFFFFLHKNIHYDHSLEPSCSDGFNEGSQCMLSKFYL